MGRRCRPFFFTDHQPDRGGKAGFKNLPPLFHSLAPFGGQFVDMEQIYYSPAVVRRFLQSEDGAVTVDWLALTAVIAMLGLGVGFAVSAGVPELAKNIGSFVGSYTGAEG